MMIIKQTKSYCPKCLALLPAVIKDDNDAVMLEKKCEEHGSFYVKLEKDVELYKSLMHIHPRDIVNCSILLMITHKCNINCEECYVPNRSKPDMTLNQFEDYLIQAKINKNIKEIILGGGEPTMHPQFIDFIRKAASYNFSVVILTNGINITEDLLRKIGREGIAFLLHFNDFKDNTRLEAAKNIKKHIGMLQCVHFIVYRNKNEHIIKDGMKYALSNDIPVLKIRSCLYEDMRLGKTYHEKQYFMSELLEMTSKACGREKDFFKNYIIRLGSKFKGVKHIMALRGCEFEFEIHPDGEIKVLSPFEQSKHLSNLKYKKLHIQWFNWHGRYKLDYEMLNPTPMLHQDAYGKIRYVYPTQLEDL